MIATTLVAAWLQYAAGGGPQARAVLAGRAACPALVIDGRARPMRRRAGPAPRFADTVCVGDVPAGARRVRVGDRRLPPPAHDPRRIAVLGDTGCRLGGFVDAQACDDPQAWPFPRIARRIAAAHPDLVVHVGDDVYRERACPPLVACGGSPHGDDAPTWYADLLVAGAPIFAAAPIVVVRGNHEVCARNGDGWFRYLDPGESTACRDHTAPYAVDLGTLRLVVLDSAIAEDRHVTAADAAPYRPQFARVRALAGPPRAATTRWFLTHRPPYFNADERAAMGDALRPYDAVLAGHLHFFAAANVRGEPPIVVNGEGGTKLDPDFAPFLQAVAGDLHVEGTPFSVERNGFGLYERGAAGWTLTVRGANGAIRASCSLAARVVCR